MSTPSRRAAFALTGLSLALNVAYFAQFQARDPFAKELVADSYRYDAIARELVSNGFRYQGVFHQAPLYPYALAVAYKLFGPNPAAVGFLQIVLAALVPLLVHRVAARVGGPRAGLAAGLLAVPYGSLWAFAPRLLPALPVVVLQLAFLALVRDANERRARTWIAPAVLLGLLCAMRPTHVLLLGWTIAAALFRRVTPRVAATVVGIALLAIAPITIHNLRADGSFLLVSSNAGETFAHGNNEGARGSYSLVAGLRSGDILRQEEVSREIAETAAGRPLRASEVQAYWFRRGWAYIRESPARYAWLELQKLRLLLGAEEAPDIYSPSLEARRYTPFLRVAFLSALVVLPFALAGAWSARRRLSHWFWAFAAMEALTMLAFYVSNRYRLSWEVLLLVPAGVQLAALGKPRAWLALVPGAALALVLHVTADRARQREAWGIILTNLGTSYARAERFPEAEGAFRSAVEVDPAWARARHYLGRSLARQQRFEEAATCFRDALEREPGLAEARVDLAATYLTLANGTEAFRALDALPAATSLAPETARSATRLAVAMARGSLERDECAGARASLALALRLSPQPPPKEVFDLQGAVEARCAGPVPLAGTKR